MRPCPDGKVLVKLREGAGSLRKAMGQAHSAKIIGIAGVKLIDKVRCVKIPVWNPGIV